MVADGERVVIARRCDGLADAVRTYRARCRRVRPYAFFQMLAFDDAIRCVDQLVSSCERALGTRGRPYDRAA